MAQLFDALPMGSLTLPHRVVMAPLTRNRAPGALAHAGMARYYAQRADPHSGAALIISEAASTARSAAVRASLHRPCMFSATRQRR